MTKFIKKYKGFLISIFIPCLIVVSLSVIKVKKDVTVPSTVNSIENIISIDGESKLKGSINVVSVYSYEKVSLLSYLFASCNRYAQIDDNIEYTNIDSKKYRIGGIIQKECSINNSIISGYKQAGYNIKFKFVGYYVDSGTTYLDKNLDIGDMIISVNGEKLNSDYTPGHAIQKAKAKTATMEIIKNYYSGNRTSSTVTVTAKEMENSEGKKVYSYGFSTEKYVVPENDESYPEFKVLWNNVDSIGPSGGLLQSFYVYEKLTGAKLSKNLKIAGTGTVDEFGNAGLIGGIKQKIISAELSNVDIFFVPVTSENYQNDSSEVNYIEALEGYKKLKNPRVKLVPVWNLSCIIDYLTEYQG